MMGNSSSGMPPAHALQMKQAVRAEFVECSGVDPKMLDRQAQNRVGVARGASRTLERKVPAGFT